jgi:hypothetical protein
VDDFLKKAPVNTVPVGIFGFDAGYWSNPETASTGGKVVAKGSDV